MQQMLQQRLAGAGAAVPAGGMVQMQQPQQVVQQVMIDPITGQQVVVQTVQQPVMVQQGQQMVPMVQQPQQGVGVGQFMAVG